MFDNLKIRRRHLFHLVSPSPWPFIASLGVFFLVTGLAFFMHRIFYGAFILFFGLVILLITSYFWFNDICEEASFCGYHTLIVKKGLKLGFYLFILSEIMLFFGFFWAFFHSAISASIFLGNAWPYPGIDVIPVFDFPLFNTALLISSGVSITWAHKGTAIGSYSNVIDSLLITILLGSLFIILQGLEYYEATFNLDDSVFSCTFYMLTGLHGCHVIVGVTFIVFCFLRFLKGHFSTRHYLGFVFAIWYWHFVDIVWIILFLSIYGWGGW